MAGYANNYGSASGNAPPAPPPRRANPAVKDVKKRVMYESSEKTMAREKREAQLAELRQLVAEGKVCVCVVCIVCRLCVTPAWVQPSTCGCGNRCLLPPLHHLATVHPLFPLSLPLRSLSSQVRPEVLQALELEAHRADTMGGELGEVKSISVTFSEPGTSKWREELILPCYLCACAVARDLWLVRFEYTVRTARL